MKHSTSELANRISRALISGSNQSIPTRTWTPKLEQTLHGLGFRDSLNPTLVSRVIDPFLINHHSLALGFFDWASQQPGFAHTSITYQSILKSLSISRQFSALDRLLMQIKSHKINLHPSVYRSVMASYISGKKPQNAFFVFNQVNSVICEIGHETCNSLLAALASHGCMSNARKVFDEMILRGVRLSTLGFGVFLWKFSRNGEIGEILSLLDEARKGNWGVDGSVLAVLVVHGLCLDSRVQEALWVLDELRMRDCKPDFIAYRVVAEALRFATRDVVGVEKVLKKKRKLGVAPRAGDYRTFILDLISERLICEAKELGEVIVSGNFPIEGDVLNALIGSVASDDPSCALMFFKFLLGKDRYPTLLTLSNLSRGLSKNGKIDELLDVFQILSDREYFVDTEGYNVMVSFLCNVGKVKEAYQILQEMKKKGLGPDVTSYNSVMETCCREDLLRPAKRLWDEMFANGCHGNLKTYNILICKFSETGHVEEAHQLFSNMLEKGVAPNATTYTFLLEGLCQENQLQRALETFSKAFEQDAMLARSLLGTFILHLCKGGQYVAASNLLQHHIHGIGRPDAHVMLLKYLADSGENPMAIQHIKRVAEISPLMLPAIRTELLGSLLSSSNQDQILKLIEVVGGLQEDHAI